MVDRARNQKDKSEERKTDRNDLPAAGPHARRDLINPDLTPGSGILPDPGDEDDPNLQPTG
jgi:hypothetical protein